MLLDEIIATATDGQQSLSGLLRKCLVLAHELKDQRLKTWANQELNGYPTNEGLPDYRIIATGAYGYFAGSFGAALPNYPIPSVALKEEHRQLAEVVYLTEPVSAYESLVATANSGAVARFDWPGNLVLYYQRTFFQNQYSLISAWQNVSVSTLSALLDAVRNRTLNMALELRQELGPDPPALSQRTPAEVQRVQDMIVNNIYGGTNYFASGDSSLTATTSNTQTVISVGDSKQLNDVMAKAGISEDDLRQLSDAVRQDGGKKPGSRVLEWTTKNATKVMREGMKVGAKIGQEILTAWIKQYFGL